MLEITKRVLEEALSRLHRQTTMYLPALLAAAVLVFAAYVFAVLARWLIYRAFKGFAMDKFLRESGVAYIIAPSGGLHATTLAAETAYWLILLSGCILALNAFGTSLTTQVARSIMLLIPKLFIAALILLSGTWLGRYFGRKVVVWAVSENIPSPQRLSVLVRALMVIIAVVVAADQLQFAPSVFLAAFIIFIGGAVLAASLYIGLGKWDAARWHSEKSSYHDDSAETHTWVR